MRRVTLIICLFLIPGLFMAQDDNNYVMFETMYVTPNHTADGAFQKAMAAHNKKYHSEGAMGVNVYNVISGPNTGKMQWVMGPCKFSDFDAGRGEGHDEDWANKVMPHVKKTESGEYWKMNTERSTVKPLGPDRPPYKILFVRYHKVKRNTGYNLKEFNEKISAVMNEMGVPWGFFDNEFQQGGLGRHIATIRYYNSWTEFDEAGKFRETYEKLYGDNWVDFWNQVGDIYEDTWDEIWVHNPALSGSN